MKLFVFISCLLLSVAEGLAQVTPVPATQAEVNAGVNQNKYVTPWTLTGAGGARANMPLAMNALNTAGVLSHVVSAGTFDPLYNTSTSADLLGNPYIVSNLQYAAGPYGAAGLNARGTNFIIIPLPRILTNFTLCCWYWLNPSNVDRFLGDAQGGTSMANIYDTNTGAGFVQSEIGAGGISVWSSPSGTNYNTYQAIGNITTNQFFPMMNGQYDDRTPLGLLSVVSISGSTNGIATCWYNSKPCELTQGGQNTNRSFLSTNVPYNTLIIGGSSTNWIGSYKQACTNAFAVIGGWILFDQRVDDNPAINVAAYQFATDLTRYGSQVVDFGGASIINFAFPGGNIFQSGTVSESNSLCNIFQSQNPTVLTLCDAAPGSTMANYANQSGFGTNAFFAYDLFNLDTNRFPNRLEETDGPRNDILGGVSTSIVLGYCSLNWTCFFTNGIPVYPIFTHWAYSSPTANNMQWQLFQTAMYSNLPIAGIIDESIYCSSNLLSKISLDNPPTHQNQYSLLASMFQSAFAQICAFKPWPIGSWYIPYMTMQNPIVNDFGDTNYNMFDLVLQDGNGSSRYMAITNTPTNGNTLRFTNGMWYFAP